MNALLKQARETALRKLVTAQLAAAEHQARPSGRVILRGVLGVIICMVTLEAATGIAWAAGGCSSQATSSILSFITSATDFAIGIGAGGSVLMLAILAVKFFTYKPHLGDQTRMGGDSVLTSIKNVCIGLAVLAGLAFFRFVVINFIAGATGNSTPSCLTRGM